MRIMSVGLLVVAVVVAPSARSQDRTTGLTPAWSLPGPWTGVAADENRGVIYAVGLGRGVEVDVTGQMKRGIKLPPNWGAQLRLGRLPGTTLLTFRVWGSDLCAFDLNGNRLWTYPGATGIDDVWAADLDSDRSDEVIVGYNGGTGVHVLDGRGHLRWKSTTIGNVWHVSAGDVLGEGRAQVVTTSARGAVHIFNSDGTERVDLDAGLYTDMVRVGVEDGAATIFGAGTTRDSIRGTSSIVVNALSGDGVKKWSLTLPADDHPALMVRSAHVASTERWLALGTSSGRVYVVDTTRGEIIGEVDGQGTAEVGWAGESPLLLVATGSALNAFHVMAAN